jgi:hypothetical protein
MICSEILRTLHFLGKVMLNRITLLVPLALLFSPVALAGSVIEIDTVQHITSPPLTGTIRISTQGRKTRLDIDSGNGDSSALIYDGDKDEMMVFDHAQKKYFVMTKEQMNAMAVQVSDAMKQMEEALAAMPPEQRKMAEQMMAGRMPAAQPEKPASTVNKAGGSDTIAGFDCENYEVISEGRRVRQMCVASWDDIDGGRESADAFMDFAGFFSDMREAFSEMGDMSAQQEMFGHLESLGGYPVLSRDYDEAGALSGESRVTTARSESIDPSAFTPPAGYQLQPMY